MHDYGLTGDRLQAPEMTQRYIKHYQAYLETSESMLTDDESFTDFLIVQLFGLALAFGVLVVEIFHKKFTKKMIKWFRVSYGEQREKVNRLTIRRRRFNPIRMVKTANADFGATMTPTHFREAEVRETLFDRHVAQQFKARC